MNIGYYAASIFGEIKMAKAQIHPKWNECTVSCNCGHTFIMISTNGAKTLSLESCSTCHKAWTGEKKLVIDGGRVARFKDRYKKRT